MYSDQRFLTGAVAIGMLVAGTSCSTSRQGGELVTDRDVLNAELLASSPAQAPSEPAVLTVNRTDIDDEIEEMVGAVGLAVDPSYDPNLLGRVSLRWSSEPVFSLLSDVSQRRDIAPRGLGFDLADTTPWSIGPSRAVAIFDADFEGDELRLDYQIPFTTSAPGGINVKVAPRAQVVSGDLLAGVGGGAVVRLGHNLSQPRSGSERLGWHLFFGADAQALTLKLNRNLPVDRAVRVEDFQMIGDIQGGVAMEAAGGDLAFGVVQRDVTHLGATARERFTGVTYKVHW